MLKRRFMLAGSCLLALACLSAETPAAPHAQGPSFDSARAWKHLEALVAIGPRPSGSAGAEQAREYIRQQLAALGLKTTDQAFDAETPAGTIRMVNVSATVSGPAGAGPGRLIVASHYDTKRFDEATFVGANDGGSSTAFLIELARVLKDRKNAMAIELLFLDGEEAIGEWQTGNTWGSRYYVDAARADGTLKNVRAMILVDMIGDRTLTIKRDTNSTPWLVDAIWSAARRLERPEFSSAVTTVEDDHLPFLRAGVPAVDIIDLEYPDGTNAYWHTPEDTLDKLDPKSLQVVADVLLAALPAIELRLK